MSPSPGGSVFLVTSCEPGLYQIWTALGCFLRLRIMYLLSFVPSSTTLTDAISISLVCMISLRRARAFLSHAVTRLLEFLHWFF